MKLGKILNDVQDLLDGEDSEQYDVVINIGREADNVAIRNDDKCLYIEGWKGHKHPALAGRSLR